MSAVLEKITIIIRNGSEQLVAELFTQMKKHGWTRYGYDMGIARQFGDKKTICPMFQRQKK